LIKKGNKLYSILNFKCPACHDGDFFESHPYNLTKAGDIHKSCANCKTKFSKEPGFYYGAMYVSYAIAVGLSVSLYFFFELINFDFSVSFFILFYSVFILLLSPLIYAFSKIIWANIFINFTKN
jgi:uncharacterized protein (DUF983 family)